jgi:ketosteroid isomerase-like protein
MMSQTNHSKAKAAILAANAAFYRAFTEGDHAAMSALWAERAPVACFHPASAALLGRTAVLESWREILREAPPSELRCDRPVVHLAGDAAIVACYEGNGERPAHLAATNVFVLEEGHWRMVHHHAGPLAAPIPKPGALSDVN